MQNPTEAPPPNEAAAVGLAPEDVEQAQRHVERLLAEEARRPLVVSVMGQTGVGKSSLVNALFGTSLETGAVKPTTKQLQEVVTDHDGHQLVFCDLPGIGEGEHQDQGYLELYRRTLERSDVAIWAVHADSRSVAFDRRALEHLLDGLGSDRERVLFNKIAFVLTKADLATAGPWILGLQPRRQAKFATTEDVLDRKAEYFRETLIEPFGHLMTASTYNDAEFCEPLPNFSFDANSVMHEGYLSAAALDSYCREYPQHEELFRRLGQNYEVVPCSARYRFNLTKLMLLVLNRLGPMAVGRFQQFLDVDALDQLPVDAAKRFRNFVVVDPRKRKVVLDLADAKL